jgi:hypothetical protein
MIQAPNWQKNATPTTRGWVFNGELIKSQKISEADIKAFNAAPGTTVSLNEAPSYKAVEVMSKQELNELNAHHGVEVVANNEPKKGLKGFFSKKSKNTLTE